MSADDQSAGSSREAPTLPYPAAVSILGAAWHSHLAHDGTVPLIHPKIHVGLLETNDVVLTDPTVSRLHAVIEWAPQGYIIRDLGSGTGTFVEGRQISGPTALAPGQHIRIGSTDLYFQAVRIQGSAAPAPPPTPPGTTAPAITVLPMQAITNAVKQAESSGLQRGLARHGPKSYWRVFLSGLAIFIASWILLEISGNPHLVPLVAMSAAAVVPVTFVTFCWEQGAFVDM
ncbi:MAG TPA: FHA domain-containing protein, partial [Dehalococcoidia bacterium]|nr:FHA domain-containing protein [Dehalococcoidia bacterium]